MRDAAIDTARRAAGSVWFRAAGSLVLLGLVSLQVDWRTAEDRVAAGEWAACASAVGLILAAFVVGAVRWHGLLRGAGVDLTFGRTLRAYMVGMFTNNFLPTGFGGDATRALIAGRSGTRLVRVATSVLADRITSVGCLVLLAWLAFAADNEAVPRPLLAGLLTVTLAGALGSGVVTLVLWRGGRFARRMPASVFHRAREVRSTLLTYSRQPTLLAGTLALGLLFQALTIAATWLLADSLGLDLPFALLAAVVPIVLIATVLPISLAGFGVREGSYVILLATAGVGTTDAALLSLMTAATLAVASTVGALPIMLRGSQPTQQRGPASS
jgi:uncharacterized membrane protein YbhN (UPF0104 family)